MNLKECTDFELISEVFSRMYNKESGIIAAKIWTIDDVISCATFNCTEEMAREIVDEELSIDALIDCDDFEWDEINYAVRKYKEKKGIKDDNRTI